MKKAFLALAAVALLFATSCKKESVNPAVDVPEGSFLATIDNGANPQNAPVVKDGMSTMTTIDANRFVIWENNDQIAINGVAYKTDTEGSSVVFTPSDPAQQATGTTFHAFFPASIAGTDAAGTLPATQTIELDGNNNITVRNLPMYATSTDNQLTFHNICAALKITIPSFLNGATSIEVSSSDKAMNGAFTVTNNTAVMTATTPTDAEKKVTIAKASGTFATGEVVYIALPANTYSNFKVEFFYNTTSMWNNTLTTCTLDVNKVYPVTMTEMPDANLLPGIFSISSTEKVQFTKGNLTGTAPNYVFATSQTAMGDSYEWINWQSTTIVSGHNGYKMLTHQEWHYILYSRSMPNGVPSYKHQATVEGKVGCLVIYPDNFPSNLVKDSYNATEWDNAEAAGAVCLVPNNFDNGGASFTTCYNGYYWTSQILSNNTQSYRLYFQYKIEDQSFLFGGGIQYSYQLKYNNLGNIGDENGIRLVKAYNN